MNPRDKRSRGDKCSGTGRSASRRALRKQLGELQRKTSTKSPEADSDSELSECTDTIAEMAKMLADLESKKAEDQGLGEASRHCEVRPAAAVTASGPGEAARSPHAAATGTGGRAHGPTRTSDS